MQDKTIKKHIFNVDFYINDFLCNYEPQHMREGCHDLSGYLGDWFIRKGMSSSRSAIKEASASIKKFYKCMLELSYIDSMEYQHLCSIIKEEMPRWQSAMDVYWEECD